jgi:transposase InsO family protein
VHAAVDDHSRLAYVEVHAVERAASTTAFLRRAGAFFSSHGVRIEWVMTDNAWTYRLSKQFQEALAELGADHILIPPRRPQVNGKVERFNRTLLEEWAYVRLYRSNGARVRALSRWVSFYSSRSSHRAGRPASPGPRQ